MVSLGKVKSPSKELKNGTTWDTWGESAETGFLQGGGEVASKRLQSQAGVVGQRAAM